MCIQQCNQHSRGSEKLVAPATLAAVTVGLPKECRLYIVDRNTSTKFLVDSGSVVSIIPKRVVAQPLQKQSLSLQAANGTPIATFGTRNLTLNLGLRRSFSWPFIIADVQTAILGADVLKHHGLIIDLQGRRLLDDLTKLSTTCVLDVAPAVHSLCIVSPTSLPKGDLAVMYQQLVDKFARKLSQRGEMATIPDMPIHHHIVTTGPPVFSRPRRLAGERLAAAKQEFHLLLERGVIRPSSSQWASPLHMVSKAGGGWRATGDYRQLNVSTQPDRYPLPVIEDLLQEAHGEVFSVIDLHKAFHQIPVAPDDIAKTAVTTPFGLFEFVGMPLGLRNAAQTMQRMTDHILRKFEFVRGYVDDFLVFSDNHQQHLDHLEQLLNALQEARLQVNWGKCQIGLSEVIFAGYHVSRDGYRPPAAKTQAILDFPKPEHSTQLRRFIGVLNFYRRCIPHAADIQAPLTEMLKGITKKKAKLVWSPDSEEAFERCKRSIASATPSAFLSPSRPLALHTDASNTAIGASLDQQLPDDTWVPLGFFSRKLSETEQRYSTYDRELLAIFSAVKHFRSILEGRQFLIFTDHRPLSYAFSQRPDKTSPRRSRQLDFIAQFDTAIKFTPGQENIVADALSRVEAVDAPTALKPSIICSEQASDEQQQHLLANARLKLRQMDFEGQRLTFLDDNGIIKPYLPLSLRRQAFDNVHRLSHPSGRATAKRIASKYFWPSLRKDVYRWAKQCVPCQRSKVNRHNRAELGNFNIPDGRFDHIHIDLIKLPESQGFENCLTVIDRYTRWPQAIPVSNTKAATVARALYDGWVAYFGTPLTITSDQGPQFEADLVAQCSRLFGAERIHTTPYHPQANGMVERMHRTLKAALKCIPETPWTQALPSVLLGMRTTFKEDLQASPAEMLFGTSLRIPGEFLVTQETTCKSPEDFVTELRRLFRAIRPVPAARHVNHRPFVFKDLRSCEYVFRRVDAVRKPLESPYTGPHRVIKRVNERTYVVDVNGVVKTFSTDQLKPAYLASADESPSLEKPAYVQTPRLQTPPEVLPQSHTRAEPKEQPAVASQTQPRLTKKQVTFSFPSPSGELIGEGVAVAPLPVPTTRRRPRKQVLIPRAIFE